MISLGSFDVLLVYDVSGSMAFETQQIAPNGGSQRGDWARDGANAFVDGLPAPIRLGLNQFAGPSSVVIGIDALGELDPLSPHRTALRTAINGMPRNGVTGTNIANAISVAAQVLNSSGANTDSKHIVLVTDGDSTSGNPVNATSAAIASGINTVNTIALPGANVSLLTNIANAGNGTFVDGTNPSNLIAGFTQILNDAETLEKLDILFPDGSVMENLPVDPDGRFSIALPVVAGDNLFTARATSNLGNVHTADILIQGILVPEPSSLALAILSGMTVLGIRFGDGSRNSVHRRRS